MSNWSVVMVCASLLALAMVILPTRQDAARPFAEQPSVALGGVEVAYALELIALALEGGAPTAAALSAVGESSSSEHVQTVLRRVCAGLQWGLDERTSWASAPAIWAPAARAFALAGRAGAAPSQLLHAAAEDVRAAEAERVAEGGAKAGVYIVLPLGLCFLPAFLLITVVPLVLGLIRI